MIFPVSNLIGNVSLCGDDDEKWVWSLHASGALNVKSLVSMIQDKLSSDCNLGKHQCIMCGIHGPIGRSTFVHGARLLTGFLL